MSLHPVLTALAFGGAAGFLGWTLGPESPSRATQELRAIYDRQAAGWTTKDLDEVFTHVDPKAVFTGRNGNQQTLDDSKTAVQSILYHGNDFQEHWTIAGFRLDGDTATVLLRFHNEYTMANCNWNSARGVQEPFQEDGSCIDIWQRQYGQWHEVSSTSKTCRWRRHGVPFSPA